MGGQESHVPEPQRKARNWDGKESIKETAAANREWVSRERGREPGKRRTEKAEQSMARMYGTGGMRRVHWRGHANIRNRLLIHACGYNLGVLMRNVAGIGTPRTLQGQSQRLVGAVSSAIAALVGTISRLLEPFQRVREHFRADPGRKPASAAPDQPDSSLNTAAHGASRKREILHRLLADNNGSVRGTPQRVIRNTLIQNDQQCSAISPRCEPVQQNRNSHQDCIKTCGTERVRRLPATTHNGATNVPRS